MRELRHLNNFLYKFRSIQAHMGIRILRIIFRNSQRFDGKINTRHAVK